MKKIIFYLSTLCICWGNISLAQDTIILNDGIKIIGELIKNNNNKVVVKPQGKSENIKIKKQNVSEIRKYISPFCRIDRNRYEVDENGYVKYSTIVDSIPMSKDSIFSYIEDYFTLNYGKGNNVIDVKDKNVGKIIGKGLFPDILDIQDRGYELGYEFDCWHILKIEIKDNRAKITIYLTEYNVLAKNEKLSFYSRFSAMVTTGYPFVNDNENCEMYGKAFTTSYIMAFATVENLRKKLRNIEIKNDKDW